MHEWPNMAGISVPKIFVSISLLFGRRFIRRVENIWIDILSSDVSSWGGVDVGRETGATCSGFWGGFCLSGHVIEYAGWLPRQLGHFGTSDFLQSAGLWCCPSLGQAGFLEHSEAE